LDEQTYNQYDFSAPYIPDFPTNDEYIVLKECTVIPQIPPIWEQVTVCIEPTQDYQYLVIYAEIISTDNNTNPPIGVMLMLDQIVFQENSFENENINLSFSCITDGITIGDQTLCQDMNYIWYYDDGSSRIIVNDNNTDSRTLVLSELGFPINNNGTFILTSALSENTGLACNPEANTCHFEKTYTIHVDNTLEVEIIPDNYCFDNNLNELNLIVNGGTVPYSYVWSPDPVNGSVFTTPTVECRAAGWYAVTVTDVNGCIGTATVSISAPPVISTTTEVICLGETATLIASGSQSYFWTHSEETTASVQVNPIVSTTYTVVSTNEHNCLASSSITIGVLIPPIVSIAEGMEILICQGEEVVLNAEGADEYFWQWDNHGNFEGNPLITTPNSTTIYTVTGFINNGCSASSFISVAFMNNTISASYSDELCFGQETSVQLQPDDEYDFYWNPSTGLSSTIGANVTINPSQNCSSFPCSVTYTVSGVFSPTCTTTTYIPFTVFDQPTIIANVLNSPLCSGESTIINATGAVNYLWHPFNSLSASSGQSVVANPVNTTTYTVTGFNQYGCSAIASATVEVYSNPTTISPLNPTICSGNSVSLNATGAITYTWFPPAGLSSTNGASVNANPLVTTMYTVTSTDVNGCTNFNYVTVFVGNNPTVTLNSVPSQICPNQTATITASGASTYIWSPNTNLSATSGTTIHASPGVTTTYTVLGTAMNGCTASETITIDVMAPPDIPIFSFDQYDNCINMLVDFTINNFSADNSYEWDFENIPGQPHLPANGPLSQWPYSQPGQYLVSLIASNACGQTLSEQVISVVPSLQGYNENCCSDDLVYDYIDATLTADLSGTGTPILVQGILTIPTGYDITFSDLGMQFGPNGKIIVEPGASLTLLNAQLSGLKACNNMWQGIEVWGNANSPDPGLQGHLMLSGNSNISHAHYGVFLGRKAYCFNNHNIPGVPLCKITKFIPAYSGGYISSITPQPCGFEGNACDIYFTPYNFTNHNKIEACDFSGGQLRDPGYLSSNSYVYPNANNHLYPPANALQRTVYGIYIQAVFDPILSGCSFSNMETAVLSFNSRHDVRACNFRNLTTGIDIQNTAPAFAYRHNVTDENRFLVNQNENINTAIIVSGGVNDIISDNVFLNSAVQSSFQNGIILKNTSGFELTYNRITKAENGLAITNSGPGGGLVSGTVSDAQGGNGNSFTQCLNPLTTMGDNSKLQVKCNYFKNSETPFVWQNAGLLPNQGQNPFAQWILMPADKAPAGNEFLPADNRTIYSTKKFYYYRHKDIWQESNSAVKVTPMGYTVGHFHDANVINSNRSKMPTSCNRKVFPNRDEAITAYKSILATLENEMVQLHADLDKGRTAELLNDLAGNPPAGQLKKKLVSCSPLSDEVLLAFIARNQTPPGHFKEVIQPNSPVSETVFPHLEQKLPSLPQGIRQQILSWQAYNPGARTPAMVERDINETENQYQLYKNEITLDWLRADSLANVYQLLETENTNTDRQILAAQYLADSTIAVSAAKLAQYEVQTPEDAAWVELMSLMLALSQQGKTLWELDSAQEMQVRQIATSDTFSLAATNAQAILYWIYGEKPVAQEMRSISFTMQEPDCQGCGTYKMMDIFPNPSHGISMVSFAIPEFHDLANLKIYDTQGKLVWQKAFSQEVQQVEINLQGQKSGLYFISLENDGVSIANSKIVLINKEH
jgi:hypothetical protein